MQQNGMDERPPEALSTSARVARFGSALALAAALAVPLPAAGQAAAPFTAAKSFVPATILSGNPTTLTVRLQNTDKALPASSISFVDTFPAGMVLVPGVDPTFQCGGTLVLTSGAFTFSNGSVAPASICNVTVTVTVTSPVNLKLTNVTSAIAYSYGKGLLTIPGVTGGLAVTGGTAPTITSAPPPSAQLGVPYDSPVTVTGTAPIAVSASGLPPGLSFSPATLRITGTPTAIGNFSGTIFAANGFLPNAVQSFTIAIQPPPLTIVTPPAVLSPPVAVGSPIDVTLQAVGGLPPYLWSVAGGALPPGVTLGTDGRLSGTPSKPGTYTFDARVGDSVGTSTVRTYTLVIVKIDGKFGVSVKPNPATSGQTVTVTATVSGSSIAPTGNVDVWFAGTGTRCPAPFEFGDPANPVAPLRTAALDTAGRAVVAIANLKIDDYGICVHYGGDANFSEAFAGPIDAYVIKGALIAPPKVTLSVPGQVTSMAAIPTQVTVAPVDTPLVPGGAVRVLGDGVPVASAMLADGVAWVVLAAPATEGTVTLVAEYAGDGTFPPAASPPVPVKVALADGVAIPALSDAALALLALALGAIALRALRRRPRA